MFTTRRRGVTALRSDSRSFLPITWSTCFLLCVQAALAQNPSAASPDLVLREGTPVHLRLVQTISSAHAHKGDHVDFEVLEDVNQQGLTVIHAGAKAWGTVAAVHGTRPFGLPGHLTLQADSVELANGQIASLRSGMEFKGHRHQIRMVAEIVGASLIFLPAAPAMLLQNGGDSYALKTAETTAFLQQDVPLSAAAFVTAAPQKEGIDAVLSVLPPRVFDGHGREGDMVNLVFVAQPGELQEAFEHAGWTSVDMNNHTMAWHLLCHGTHDVRLPMAHYFLFGRGQDFSFALPDPLFILSRRHHIRIWKTKYLVNNTPVWVAAATHDVSIVMHRMHITHRIDPEVDSERDFIGDNLTGTKLVATTEYIPSQQPVFEATTTGGQPYHSDSRILLVKFTPQAASATQNSPTSETAPSSSAPATQDESKTPARTSSLLVPPDSQALVSPRNGVIVNAGSSAP